MSLLSHEKNSLLQNILPSQYYTLNMLQVMMHFQFLTVTIIGDK